MAVSGGNDETIFEEFADPLISYNIETGRILDLNQRCGEMIGGEVWVDDTQPEGVVFTGTRRKPPGP